MHQVLRRRLIELPGEEQRLVDEWLRLAIAEPHEHGARTPPIAPWRFLTHLCDRRGLVAHGSPQPGLREINPIERNRGDLTEFGNTTQVFATPDALWAMWFALLDRNMPHGFGTANSCERVVDREGVVWKHYWFAVDRRNLSAGPVLASGTVYLLRPDSFTQRNGEEWGSFNPVKPLAEIQVEPEDWPYRDRIVGYDRERLDARLEKSTDGFPWFDDGVLWPDLHEV